MDIAGHQYMTPTSELEWRPAVYGIIIRDGNALLSRQFGDKFALPGGGLNLGEVLKVLYEWSEKKRAL